MAGLRLRALLLLACACAAEPVLDESPAAPAPDRAGLTRGGRFWVTWAPRPDPVPVNEPFELDVTVCEGQDRTTPVDDARLFVSGWMPGHGHGMHREPRAVSKGDGLYRVRGMLFHMRGAWELNLDVVRDGWSERIRFDLELP